MTPLAFEALYQAEWQELEELLDQVLKRTSKRAKEPLRGERIAALYRRACEHLALARAPSYPAYLLDRLDRLTADAHCHLSTAWRTGASALVAMCRAIFRALCADHVYVWLATALFAVPMLVLGVLVYTSPLVYPSTTPRRPRRSRSCTLALEGKSAVRAMRATTGRCSASISATT
jgi:hypothetical protein